MIKKSVIIIMTLVMLICILGCTNKTTEKTEETSQEIETEETTFPGEMPRYSGETLAEDEFQTAEPAVTEPENTTEPTIDESTEEQPEETTSQGGGIGYATEEGDLLEPPEKSSAGVL